MVTKLGLFARLFVAAIIASSAVTAFAGGNTQRGKFCMDVDLGPFHMVPGFTTPEGACAVRDYWDGWLQENFYPFTIHDHPFNCEVFGDFTPLPTGDYVPSSGVSEGDITGTIGGHPFTGSLLYASQTNWYANFCEDPPNAPCVQLAQPFFNLIDRDPYPRFTEVSVLDGVVMVEKNKTKTAEVPIIVATRAAGITQLESLDPLQVGASVTHSLLGLVTYDPKDDRKPHKVLSGSLDALLQGHIFFPGSVENDPGAARIRGALCSEDLYKRLNQDQD